MKKGSKLIKKVTIDELAGMIKKGFDLVATKEDLKKYATKEDLEKLVTKEDLLGMETNLTNRIERLEENVLRLESTR